jgi:sphingoid base N-palmitoyltransferase
MCSMAFYWSLTFSQFFDRKRKDFWEMFSHHVICLILFAFSWVCNIHRVGSVILLVHDSADVILDAAKSLNYAKMKKSCDAAFALFTVTWIVTRLVIFPKILYACLFKTLQPAFPAYFMFNSLLCCLLVLHLIWTVMIFQVIAKSIKSGGVEGDVRSSSEECELDEKSDKICVNGDEMPSKADKFTINWREEKSEKKII